MCQKQGDKLSADMKIPDEIWHSKRHENNTMDLYSKKKEKEKKRIVCVFFIVPVHRENVITYGIFW